MVDSFELCSSPCDSGSGVHLSNDCYDITLGSFYIQDFGQPGQSAIFDVLATTKSPDDGTDGSRSLVFALDLSTANISASGHAVKIRSADLLLAGEGAQEFNELATGTGSGPFTDGQFIGKARTTIRFQFSQVAA